MDKKLSKLVKTPLNVGFCKLISEISHYPTYWESYCNENINKYNNT